MLKPKDHGEAVALFRSEIVGALARQSFDHGELHAELVALTHKRFRPPDSTSTRNYSFPTLERWYYAYKAGGLEALRPSARSDRGRARELTDEQRTLLCDIRREHPSASVPLILRTLVADGRLAEGAVSAPTVRRLFVEHGLDRVPLRDGAGAHTRLRWQAERPGALWHGDVCHGPSLLVDGHRKPLRIHALLDDASRFLIALEAHHAEREVDMLGLLARALRRHAAPDALYLDNGSTYSGAALRVACERLGITLVHARPYDAPARGKMERFWRTLREGCLDVLGALSSLHDVTVRLHAFVDQHYHVAPHAALLGKSPAAVYAQADEDPLAERVTEAELAVALTVRERRRVRRDTTISVDGTDWQLDQGFLAGRVVLVAHCLLDPSQPPVIEHDGKRYACHALDPVANARLRRPPRRARPAPPDDKHTPFDPPTALLDRAARRPPTGDRK